MREAFNLAFPFEDINKSLFYGQYKRIDSYFDGIPLAAEGLPEGRELEILEEVKDQVPPEVFTEVYKNPVGNTPDRGARQPPRRRWSCSRRPAGSSRATSSSAPTASR